MGEVISWLGSDTEVPRWAIGLLIAVVIAQNAMVGLSIKALRESTAALKQWANILSDKEDPNA